MANEGLRASFVFARAENAYTFKDKDKAARLYVKYLQYGTDSERRLHTHIRLGTMCDDAKDVNGAIEHYRNATDENPDFAFAKYALGTALIDTGNLEEGIGHITRAISLDIVYLENLDEMVRTNEAVAGVFREVLRAPSYTDLPKEVRERLIELNRR